MLNRLAAQPLQIAVFSRAQEPLRAASRQGCQANLVQEPFHWMRRSEALARALFYGGGGAVTTSLSMRGKTGTVRTIEARHSFEKLMRFSAVKYD